MKTMKCFLMATVLLCLANVAVAQTITVDSYGYQLIGNDYKFTAKATTSGFWEPGDWDKYRLRIEVEEVYAYENPDGTMFYVYDWVKLPFWGQPPIFGRRDTNGRVSPAICDTYICRLTMEVSEYSIVGGYGPWKATGVYSDTFNIDACD